ncbi:TIGR02679 family protein [Streptomyces lanatus]|uniref:TIGR02679 family protein n=1 Tax=Streptomyces lanatus TaxID=66900 RepID=A0ABV1Y5X4_9ACTN|nr:TIGR02679 family protein [Streptomyces lanatus]GHH30436.1 hypothetical protein GCM10018780_89870 [Streptomyces lanatus]
MTTPRETLPEPLRSYLAHPSLRPVWAAARARLERNRLTPQGSMQISLDEEAAHRLAGLLGTPLDTGTQRLPLKRLDTALRTSAAECGLLTAVADLTGGPLHDRAATREQHQEAWAGVWQRLDTVLAQAGLAHAPWISSWIDGLRASRLLSRSTPPAAASALSLAVATLQLLPRLTSPQHAPSDAPGRELAELAALATHDAHGLDDGTLPGTLVLRAIAAAHDLPAPVTSLQRRQLWEQVDITTDLLSSTVLTWHLQPQGDSSWPDLMRQRTSLGLASHLTLQELRSPAVTHCRLARPGQIVYACENPQVLQAAVRHGTTSPLICTSGNPSHAAWALFERLHADGADIRYHGDFDWPGIAIATRIFDAGARPWRMKATDYRTALTRADSAACLPLQGSALPTPWDPPLSSTMDDAGIALHEEGQLRELLADLATSSEPAVSRAVSRQGGLGSRRGLPDRGADGCE